MARRPLYTRFYWTTRDYAKRVWDNSGEDNVFFLAGGIAFNLLLAAVPFLLLLVDGKLFDIKITIIATLLLVGYTALNAYLAVATTRGFQVLTEYGLRTEVMGGLEYALGRLLAFVFITTMFFSLYKFLPNRRIRWKTALVAALFTSAMFEIARNAFSAYVRSFNPGSLYTGALTAIVVIVIWVYYASLIFILGGEVGQVFELRRVRRMQREVFTE